MAIFFPREKRKDSLLHRFLVTFPQRTITKKKENRFTWKRAGRIHSRLARRIFFNAQRVAPG